MTAPETSSWPPDRMGIGPCSPAAISMAIGKPDLVSGPYLAVLYGKGDGTFTAGPSYSTVFPNGAAVGDFNHDGHLDIAAVTPYAGVYILWGQSGGTFTTPNRISTFPASSINAADLNHDGYLDLVAG